MTSHILESLYWKKAYITTLKRAKTKPNTTAKVSADQYIADYKVRKDVPEFKKNSRVWAEAYFALLGLIEPAKLGNAADLAVKHYNEFVKTGNQELTPDGLGEDDE